MRRTTDTWTFLIHLVALGAIFLSSCVPTPAPDNTPDIIPTATEMELPFEENPNIALSDSYLVIGIEPEGFLNLYENPDPSSQIIGQVAFGAAGLIPTGEIVTAGQITWILIQTQDLTGWMDLSFLAEQQGELPPETIQISHRIVHSLRDGDYGQLAGQLHPDLCLRISPYPYLSDQNPILCSEELVSLMESDQILNWGNYDGTGDPIDLSFQEYHARFIYDADYFSAPVVGLNQAVGSGNAINNIAEIYPDGIMVEYHFSQIDPQYGGLDWRSLRLVLVPYQGQLFLAAIVHGEWTI
jgi:hypothetical protein